MKKTSTEFIQWIPALIIMAAIFWFSSRTSAQLPNFGLMDRLVKKGGHILGYGMLAVSYWYAFEWQGKRQWLAWLLAILYALTDEFHQSFVPGRHPTIWDVLIFDNIGTLISLWLMGMFIKKRSALPEADRR